MRRPFLLFSLSFFVAAGVFAIAATAAVNDPIPSCRGKPATIVGTEGNDAIEATAERDVIWAGLGEDTVRGGLGSDLICGGPGGDFVDGGRGNDFIDGGGGAGDRVIGGFGDDTVLGGPGDRDEVAGYLGIDVVNGGPGNEDLVHGDYGYDLMYGGKGGGDIASFATAVTGGGGAGVWASLAGHRARGDGHDKLAGFESLEGSAFDDELIGSKSNNVIDGGPGDDRIFGGGGQDQLEGGEGSDGCRGAKQGRTSCGREAPTKASAWVQLDPAAAGGAGLQVIAGGGNDRLAVGFDRASASFDLRAAGFLAAPNACAHPSGDAKRLLCPASGPGRWLTVDLGSGDDRLDVLGSLAAVGTVRFAGGPGNDAIHGGPEEDLIESGAGADRLYGGSGSDGLVGGQPGPTFIYGGPDGDLLAAGGGCAGGALVGGPGRDDASFAESQAHPGLLIVSFPLRKAWIDAVKGCRPVHLAPSDEDMEGSFDNDVLIGNARENAMLGQPGRDVFVGNGGGDTIDARDGVRDESIRCGHAPPPKPRHPKGKGGGKHKGQPGGRRIGVRSGSAARRAKGASLALVDPFDPRPIGCAEVTFGHPVPGLPH
jgi:Ca2+-binding RTX toxin-like protein